MKPKILTLETLHLFYSKRETILTPWRNEKQWGRHKDSGGQGQFK